jgi:hypothetical protein
VNDNERSAAFDALRALMISRGFEWVVGQAEDEIRQGKSLELQEPVRVKLPGHQRTSRIETGTVTVSFTPMQRLETLVGAARRAMVVPSILEADVVNFFRGVESESTVIDIKFDGEAPADGEAITLGGTDEVRARAQAAQVLDEALRALLDEARR